MSRQLDLKREQREETRRSELVKALDFGIAGALSAQGIDLLGLAIKYGAFDCLLTIKADINGTRSVCFVGSDTMINCILKAQSDALRQVLVWRDDRYHPKQG